MACAKKKKEIFFFFFYFYALNVVFIQIIIFLYWHLTFKNKEQWLVLNFNFCQLSSCILLLLLFCFLLCSLLVPPNSRLNKIVVALTHSEGTPKCQLLSENPMAALIGLSSVSQPMWRLILNTIG